MYLSDFSLGDPRTTRPEWTPTSSACGESAQTPKHHEGAPMEGSKDRPLGACRATCYGRFPRGCSRPPTTGPWAPPGEPPTPRGQSWLVDPLYQRTPAKSDFTQNNVSELIVLGHSPKLQPAT